MRKKTIRRSLRNIELKIHDDARFAYEMWLLFPRVPGITELLTNSEKHGPSADLEIDAIVDGDKVQVIGKFNVLHRLPREGQITILALEGMSPADINEYSVQQVFRESADHVDGRVALGCTYEAFRRLPRDLCLKLTGFERVTMQNVADAAGVGVRSVRHQLARLRAMRLTESSLLEDL